VSDQAACVRFLIVGTPRSGTTVVQRLALGLAGIARPPETHFFTDLVPGLMQRRRLPLDLAAARSEAGEFLRLPNSSGLSFDPEAVALRVAATAGGVIDLFDAVVAELVGHAEPVGRAVPPGAGTMIGEKTPDHLLWWKPVARARPEMRFVVVVRHPLDAIASNLDAPFRTEATRRWGETYFLAMAQSWLHQQRLAQNLIGDRGPRLSLLLRYEDVVADPELATSRLARFLGRPVTGAHPGASDVVLEWEHWKSSSFDEIVPSSVGTWTRRLSAEQAVRAARIVGDVAPAFGYELPRPSLARRWRPEPRNLRRRLSHLHAGLLSQQARIDCLSLS
jgi:hypothetical protein